MANEQTAGRGRLGREFESPEDSGIYMSLHLLPCLQAEDMVLITSAAAVAVCRAIRAVTGDEPVIKWVNDIFLHDKKICGILAEAITGSDGRIHVVLGIGINVWTNKTQLSEQVQKIAGSLCYVKEASLSRNHLIGRVAQEFYNIFFRIQSREFINDYRRWSLVIGKNIRFCRNEFWIEGKAIDINEDGALLVETENGTEVLNTGEISVRLKNS